MEDRLSGLFQFGLYFSQRFGCVDVGQRGVAGDRRPRPRPRGSGRSGNARRRRLRPSSGRGRSGATTPPDCRACRRWSAPRPARPYRDRSAPISRSIRAASTCGMSPRQTMAPSTSAGSAAMPALQRRAEPVGEMRIVHECDRQPGERRLDAFALMAGDDEHRPRARGERLPRRRCAPAAGRRSLPVSLFGPPMRLDRPAREHDCGDAAALFRAPARCAAAAGSRFPSGGRRRRGR